MTPRKILISCLMASLIPTGSILAQEEGFTGLKAEAVASIESKQKLTQEIVDSLFSFSELGFQEFETQRYLTEILRDNGFDVELGVSGIPSAWWASWGSGEPVSHWVRMWTGFHGRHNYPVLLIANP